MRKKIQSKFTRRYYLLPVNMAQFNTLNNYWSSMTCVYFLIHASNIQQNNEILVLISPSVFKFYAEIGPVPLFSLDFGPHLIVIWYSWLCVWGHSWMSQGTIWCAGDQTRVHCTHDRTLPTLLYLWLIESLWFPLHDTLHKKSLPLQACLIKIRILLK